jgi:hypothetical protein
MTRKCIKGESTTTNKKESIIASEIMDREVILDKTSIIIASVKNIEIKIVIRRGTGLVSILSYTQSFKCLQEE